MTDSVKKELFEQMPVPLAARKLMVPTVLSSLVTILYTLGDTYFVGLLNNEIQSAAVALASPILISFNIANNLFGIGSSSMMSRALGKNDIDTVRKSASFGFYGSIICGGLISAMCVVFLHPLLLLVGTKADTMGATAAYMKWAVICGAIPTILNVVLAFLVRAEGASLHASIGTMSGCFLNIILDPIFILPWGLNMGAAGAGLATFLSNCAACIYFFILLAVKKKHLNIRLHPKYISLKKDIVLGVCGVGVPAAVQNLLNVTGMTVLNNFAAFYGPASVAAIGIAQKIYFVPMQICMGGTQGIMPLIGYSYTSRHSERFEAAIKFVAKLMLPCMIIITLICWICAGPLMGLFIKNEAVITYGKQFLRGFSIGMPFLLVDFLAVGVFLSIGMGKKSLLFSIVRKVIIEIPAIVILNYFFQTEGMTYCGLISETFLSVWGAILIRQIISNLHKSVKTTGSL